MLSYLFLYVLAAVLIFQGAQLLGELSGPLGTVPAEVKPRSVPAARWGGLLLAYGAATALAALLSHAYPWLRGALDHLKAAGLALEALFGFWLVFGRKVDYVPAPPSEAEAHHA